MGKAEADRDRAEQRVADLSAEALVREGRIVELGAQALAYEQHIAELDARALARDEQIIALVREVDGLVAKAEHAAVIEHAKGVIMSTMQCSADAAFAVPVAQSQRENRKVRDIAAELAALQHRE